MKRITSSKLKGLLGILLIIMAISLIYYWENYGREHFLYKEVIIAKKDIYRNERITNQNITTVMLEETNIPKGVVSKYTDILGKEAKQFIPQNAVIDDRYLANEGMTLSKDQFIFRIPNDWIADYPGSLRRGDDVYLYPVKRIEKFKAQQPMIETELSVIMLKVAYVKDSGNREVKNIENEKIKRLDATSSIHSIEVMITEEQLKSLEEIYGEGYRFLLMYQ